MKGNLSKEGWEIKFCLKCGYAVERCEFTRHFSVCPLCAKNGTQSKLQDRFVTHVPENKVVAPLAEKRGLVRQADNATNVGGIYS